ncbi:MAG: glycosyltransferase family 4 protein [Anaerolineales bacterium]|nr:glycosyltransferase family 4 protein [Anaerolineales bacterium]
MSRILIVSNDVVDEHMGGVGVRNWELARQLAKRHQVSLATPNQTRLETAGVSLIPYELEGGDLKAHAHAAQVILLSGAALHFHPYLRELGIPLGVDLYVPSLLESLVWHDQEDWTTWIPAYEEYLRVQLELLRAGDFFYCASERQRDYWLGWLHAQKRINPHTYRQDPTLRRLIDVVPFGLPDDPPIASVPALKGAYPGIAASDRLILWSGGIWDWLDPLTPIRALKLLAPRRPELKLYFMGTHHPNPLIGRMSMAEQALALSRELALEERSVFFGDWTPYAQRGAYLAEADLSVISHHEHIETHFSFRTRVLDCLWAGIPMVVTSGDEVAKWVEAKGVGLAVHPGDAQGMAQAIEKLLAAGGREAFAPAFADLRQAYRWEVVSEPLERFCAAPALAPDKGQYLTEVERIGRAKDAFLEQVARDKDAIIAQAQGDNQVLLASLKRYQSLPPVRLYHWLRGMWKKS